MFATENANLDIDGLDDKRVDVDVAVLDTGVELDHPDLNIAGGVDCTGASWGDLECSEGSPGDGADDAAGIWHGTTAASNIAALDNGIGSVGAAAGARIWPVDIAGEERYGPAPVSDPPPVLSIDMEAAIAGVEWVTEHADVIEVAYIAMICAPSQTTPGGPLPYCIPGTGGIDLVDEFEAALSESIDRGVVYVFSAGAQYPASTFIPQSHPEMLLSSQLADSDGLAGGLGAGTCLDGTSPDDQKVANSAWGPEVDVTSPECAGSWGAAHLAAAAAILASDKQAETAGDDLNDIDDVRAIETAISGDSDCATNTPDTTPNTGAANCDWTEHNPPTITSPDGIKEPLLDLHDPTTYNPTMVEIAQPVGAFASSNGWLSVFTLDAATDTIKQRVWNNGTDTWSAWSDHGSPPGGAASEPAVVHRPWGTADTRDIFVLGADSAVWQRSKPSANSAWGSWTSVSPPGAASAPAAVSPTADRVHLFVRTEDSSLWERVWTAAEGWDTWAPVPDGEDITGVGVVCIIEDYITLFARDANGDIKRRVWEESTGWRAWTNHGQPPGGTTSEPTAVARPYGSDEARDVFVNGVNGTLWRMSWNLTTGGWTGWSQVGQPNLTTAPTVASPLADTIHLVGRTAPSNALYRTTWTAPTGWTTWQAIN